jgi:phosphate transport system protein
MEMRTGFHRKLRDIQDDLLVMGSMVEKATLRAVEALKMREIALAEQVIADDCKINDKRFEIEETCVQLIATQQPMASDLRTIVGVLNILAELERMGDYAVGIATNTVKLMEEPLIRLPLGIPGMAEKSSDMLRRSLNAFINHDAEAARQIADEDDEIDEMFAQVLNELIDTMIRDPNTVNRATRLIWVAHRLERDGDRVTNICERVVFVVTGKMEEFGTSRC